MSATQQSVSGRFVSEPTAAGQPGSGRRAPKKVVIIGAGVVGASLADELTARGWTDVTVVDQGEMPKPGGSSSHAPGMVFQHHASRTMSQFAQYTVQKFLAAEFEGERGFEQVGGLEIATTPERLAELHRRLGWAHSLGLEARIISPEECAQLQPLLDPARLLGGMHTPNDGAARAVVAVNSQLRSAVERGATLLERHEVTGFRVENGAVTGVETDRGTVEAEIVVCCAGIWGPKVAAMVGMRLPMTAMEHQVAWTPPLRAFADHTEEATTPMVRHMDEGLYYRDRYDRLEIGSFAHRPIVVEAEDLLRPDEAPVMPSQHAFTPEDFAPQWEDTQRLMPETRDVEVEDGFNGIMAFTSDDFPLLGPAPHVDGLWFAEGVWVTASAGVGLAMAEWLVDGYCSSFSLHECELSRFDPHQLAPEYHRAIDVQHYIEVYDIKHPLEPVVWPRPLRVSPFYAREQALGAQFLEGGGWERPYWYESNAGLVEGREIPPFSGPTAKFWSPVIAAEAQYTRENVAVFDMTPLRHLEVTGPDAQDVLQELASGNIGRKVGSVTYCLLLDERGGIRSDITVTKLAQDRFQVGANSAVDAAWIRTHIGDRRAEVRDVTAGSCCLGLWGPKAREVVDRIASDIDFSNASFPYFRAKQGYLGTVPVTALRVSYVGELGWELYTTADLGQRLWDTLFEAGEDLGIIAAGRGAFSSLRLEKGYRSYGVDVTREHDPYQAGLGFAVKHKDFVGSEALRRRGEDTSRRLVCLTHTDTENLLFGGEAVYSGDRPVGYVTSADWGHTIGRGIAYAWVDSACAGVGAGLRIGSYGHFVEATVAEEPLFDPTMSRLRGI